MRNYVNASDYYRTFGFMKIAGLSGFALEIYAIIYHYSEKGDCTTSLKYFEDWTGADRRTVCRVLNKLENNGNIKRESYFEGKQKRIKYIALGPKMPLNPSKEKEKQKLPQTKPLPKKKDINIVRTDKNGQKWIDPPNGASPAKNFSQRYYPPEWFISQNQKLHNIDDIDI